MATKPKKPTKIITTINVTDVINVTRDIGDRLSTSYEATGDVKVASAALDAYKTAIAGSKAQLIYKKMTGKPAMIAFLEG